jgi:hypothetical protein
MPFLGTCTGPLIAIVIKSIIHLSKYEFHYIFLRIYFVFYLLAAHSVGIRVMYKQRESQHQLLNSGFDLTRGLSKKVFQSSAWNV